MPDPDTDIDLEGPDEDDAEAGYDPDGIEAARARALGLGLGYRELQAQRDGMRPPEGSFAGQGDGDGERLNRDDLTAADVIGASDANDLGIDEEFDTEETGPDAERLDDRATYRSDDGDNHGRT
jgi:hypothetical protein